MEITELTSDETEQVTVRFDDVQATHALNGALLVASPLHDARASEKVIVEINGNDCEGKIHGIGIHDGKRRVLIGANRTGVTGNETWYAVYVTATLNRFGNWEASDLFIIEKSDDEEHAWTTFQEGSFLAEG